MRGSGAILLPASKVIPEIAGGWDPGLGVPHRRITLTSILLPARDHCPTVIPAQGDRCTTVIPAQPSKESPSQRRRESRFGGSPRGSKESPSPRSSPIERPLRNRHSRARRPLHNRHSRAGGNPAFGGSPRGSKESPSLTSRETIAPPSFPKETVAQPSFPRRRESGLGVPRIERSISQRETSFPRKETVAQPSFPRRRESSVWGFPTRIERIALTSILLPARDRCTTVIPAQAGIQVWGRERRRWTCEAPSKRGRPPRLAGRGGVPASRCSRPAKSRRPGTRPSGSCCRRRPGRPTSSPSRVPLRR